MDKNPFLKRLMKVEKEDVVHSSAYAKAQNSGIGSASTESFEKRRQIDKNRTTVKGYGDSRVVNDALSETPKAKTYDKKNDAILNSVDQSDAKTVNNYDKSLDRAQFSAREIGNSRYRFSDLKGDNSSGVAVPNRFAGRPNNPGTPPARRNPGISR